MLKEKLLFRRISNLGLSPNSALSSNSALSFDFELFLYPFKSKNKPSFSAFSTGIINGFLHSKSMINRKIDKDMKLIQEAITAIRNLRKQVNLSPALEINVTIKVAETEQIELLMQYQNYFLKLAKVSKMELGIDVSKPKSSIAAVVRNIEIYLPLEGLIDIEKEKEKLEKQLAKLEKQLKVISGKLNNKKFMENAPENIVKKEKEKFAEIETKVIKTRELLVGLK